MNSQLRSRAIELRIKEQLSFGEIKKRLGIPKSTLSYWLREYPITEERMLELRRRGWSKGEASRERYRNTMRLKRDTAAEVIYQAQLKRLANVSNESIYIAGLALYLAEGDKRNRGRISIANTDPRIMRFFISWLLKFMNAPFEKIKVQLHLYEDMDIEAEIKYWIGELKIPRTQFYKASVRKMQKASFTYKESFRHGTCGLYLLGTENKTILTAAMKAFLELYKDI